MIRTAFILLAILFYTLCAWCQTDIKAKEEEVEECMNNFMSETNWKYLTEYFETYLTKSGFNDIGSIESAYIKFIRFKSRPPKPFARLQDRETIKAKLKSWKVMDGEKVYGSPFVECFYRPHTDYQNYPESTLKDIISMADVISKVEFSPNLMMGGLNLALTAEDIKIPIYKRAVILLSLVDLIYMEEVTTEVATDENPIYRMLHQNSEIINYDDKRLEQTIEPLGGFTDYAKWIYSNNKKLETEGVLGNKFRVRVSGEVSVSGSLTNIGVSRGIGQGFDEEAIRLIKAHPIKKWTVGTIAGRPVKVKVDIVIDFRKHEQE